jgi:poly(3-hydroxybutyrate) depolymerase
MTPRQRSWAFAACLVLLPASARAGVSPPCKGCTLEVPAAHGTPGAPDRKLPLLVVLHGDREHAPAAAARWRGAAKQRGWAVLALECPVDQGCKDSWWKWNGDPRWVSDQVAAVAKAAPIDPARIYLAGWSGGATYIGMHAPSWSAAFAAVVFHGGGHRPDAGCPDRPLPAYFLAGDRNPYHDRVQDLRGWFDDCRQDVVWDLVRGGDHDKEDRALDRRKALAILDWLAERARDPGGAIDDRARADGAAK